MIGYSIGLPKLLFQKRETTELLGDLYSEFHRDRKAKLLGHVLRTNNKDPLRQISFQADSAERVYYGKKRIGKPRQNWIHQTKRYVYEEKQHFVLVQRDRR